MNFVGGQRGWGFGPKKLEIVRSSNLYVGWIPTSSLIFNYCSNLGLQTQRTRRTVFNRFVANKSYRAGSILITVLLPRDQQLHRDLKYSREVNQNSAVPSRILSSWPAEDRFTAVNLLPLPGSRGVAISRAPWWTAESVTSQLPKMDGEEADSDLRLLTADFMELMVPSHWH